MIYKVKELRREVGLTQYELADAAKLPRYKIQLLEQGISCLGEPEVIRVLKMLGIRFNRNEDWMVQLVEKETGDCHE